MGITWVAPRPLKGWSRQRNRRKGRDQSNRQPIKQTISLCLRGEGQGTKNIVMFYSGQCRFTLHAMKSTWYGGCCTLYPVLSSHLSVFFFMTGAHFLPWDDSIWRTDCGNCSHYIIFECIQMEGCLCVWVIGCLHSKKLPNISFATLKIELTKQYW